MGKKSKWFSAVRKIFSAGTNKELIVNSLSINPKNIEVDGSTSSHLDHNAATAASVLHDEVQMSAAEAETELSKNGDSADAIDDPAEAETSLAEHANVALTSRDEAVVAAAIKIQTAFRGYLGRRAVYALRGMGRLKLLVEDESIKKQTATAMNCMRRVARVQSQIRSTRMKIPEDNQTLQKQLVIKKELESLETGEQWDDSAQSKERIEATLLNRQEAAKRRERAMAYAYSHQRKSSSRSVDPVFVDPTTMQWRWSSLERWIGSKESNGEAVGAGDAAKAAGRLQSTSPAIGKKPRKPTNKLVHHDGDDDESNSVVSSLSRRHSIGSAPPVRDDESIASSPEVPSYMAPTKSTRAKARMLSPLSSNSVGIAENDAGVSYIQPVRKRLSFSAVQGSSGMA